ncbi:hypothetical protein BJ508DRAFT_322374 [Ascobolus immersus RN42]|uniref:Uncharacterized protein n=1 Tax=Ascobolus immersus RN42 TaxID=1160509 RepID=A0A3N4IVX1_ASCIM|nr:hypothetical protein BJ508DRAFT_322374 [Ascobolus immersus RN42]
MGQMEDKLFCTYCGKDLNAFRKVSIRFCPKCGKNLQTLWEALKIHEKDTDGLKPLEQRTEPKVKTEPLDEQKESMLPSVPPLDGRKSKAPLQTILISSDEDVKQEESHDERSERGKLVSKAKNNQTQAVENSRRAGQKDAASKQKKEGLSGFSKLTGKKLIVKVFTQDAISRAIKCWCTQMVLVQPAQEVKDFSLFALDILKKIEEWPLQREFISEQYEFVGTPYWGLPSGKDVSRLALPQKGGTVNNLLFWLNGKAPVSVAIVQQISELQGDDSEKEQGPFSSDEMEPPKSGTKKERTGKIKIKQEPKSPEKRKQKKPDMRLENKPKIKKEPEENWSSDRHREESSSLMLKRTPSSAPEPEYEASTPPKSTTTVLEALRKHKDKVFSQPRSRRRKQQSSLPVRGPKEGLRDSELENEDELLQNESENSDYEDKTAEQLLAFDPQDGTDDMEDDEKSDYSTQEDREDSTITTSDTVDNTAESENYPENESDTTREH